VSKDTKYKIFGVTAVILFTVGSIGITLYKANKYLESMLPTKDDFDPFRNR
jgi:hypothetical protein